MAARRRRPARHIDGDLAVDERRQLAALGDEFHRHPFLAVSQLLFRVDNASDAARLVGAARPEQLDAASVRRRQKAGGIVLEREGGAKLDAAGTALAGVDLGAQMEVLPVAALGEEMPRFF